MGNTTSPFARSPFDTQIEMIRLNGTAGHTHYYQLRFSERVTA